VKKKSATRDAPKKNLKEILVKVRKNQEIPVHQVLPPHFISSSEMFLLNVW